MIVLFKVTLNIKLKAETRATHAQNRKGNANWLMVSNGKRTANILRFCNSF